MGQEIPQGDECCCSKGHGHTMCAVWQQSGRSDSREPYWDLVLQCMRHTISAGSHRQNLLSFLKDQIARARRAKNIWFFLSEFWGETAQGSSTHTNDDSQQKNVWYFAFHLRMWSHSLASSFFTKQIAFAHWLSIHFSFNTLILSFSQLALSSYKFELAEISEVKKWRQFKQSLIYSWDKSIAGCHLLFAYEKEISYLQAVSPLAKAETNGSWFYWLSKHHGLPFTITSHTLSMPQTTLSLKENVCLRTCQTAGTSIPSQAWRPEEAAWEPMVEDERRETTDWIRKVGTQMLTEFLWLSLVWKRIIWGAAARLRAPVCFLMIHCSGTGRWKCHHPATANGSPGSKCSSLLATGPAQGQVRAHRPNPWGSLT